VFESASNNGGVPGSWTILHSEPWDNTAVPLAGVLLELKAGTWQVESNAPGAIVFDNFRAARP